MKLACIALFVILSASTFAAEIQHPNVVVILTDDQGWGDLSLNGNVDLQTPNIDSLAEDGASFDRFYVCPVCSPTRAEFLTGRYHQRGGVYSTSAGGERLDLDEVTIGDTFKKAGYATAAFGKWHNGMQFPYHPNGRGFDEFYGFCSGHWGDYFSPMLEHNGEIVTGKGFCVDDFTNHAIQFIEENKAQPFFVYLPYNTPHSPMQVPDKYWERFKDKEITLHNRDPDKEQDLHLRCALAMCENIDWNVGRVLQCLDDLKLANDTIVIYFCDNGPNGYRWNGGMKGRKGQTNEGGVRSPMLIRWPGRIPAGRNVTQLGSAIDLLPTLTDLSGIELIGRRPLDGKSLKAAILGDGDTSALDERWVFSSWKKKFSVRTPRFRLDDVGKLFDMKNDPGQYKNVADKFPEEAGELREKLADWKSEMIAELGTDERPFVIAHPGHRNTQIPARDGTAHGAIERSNKHPNCSFFRNWINVEDEITWEVEVGETGDYEVELHYACPAADTGSKIELSCNGGSLVTTITEAHDPPLRGAENDRFARVESYVKDFKAKMIGTIRLKKGKGTLTLKALEKPGKEVMEFRLLVLKRVAGK